MMTRLEEILAALSENPAGFWAKTKVLRLRGNGEVYCWQNGDPMPTEPPEAGVDVDHPINIEGRLSFSVTADPGPDGERLIETCVFGADVPNWKGWSLGADPDDDDTFWVVSPDGVFKFDGVGLRNCKLIFDDVNYLLGFDQNGMQEERKGVLDRKLRVA